MERNKDQLLAINTINQNILVSASAGAGKTTVLIARLIKRIIDDEVNITDIVAMTFTEAAASEMKKRLLQALNEVVTNPATLKEKRDFAKKQLSLAENAKITTIHSFCLSIISDNYAAINLDTKMLNNILSEPIKNKYFKDAFNLVYNEYINNHYEDILFISKALNIKANNIDKLLIIADKIIGVAENNSDPNVWFDDQLNKQKNLKNLDDLNHDVVNRYLTMVKYYVRFTKRRAEELFYDENYLSKEKEINHLNKCLDDALNANDIFNFNSAIFPISLYRYTFRKPSLKLFNEQFKILVSFLVNENKYLDIANTQAKVLLILIEFCKKIYNLKQSIKFENKSIDFNDFEQMAYKILIANDYEVAKKYQNRFKEIMVDEFQDTNITQDKIIKLISNGHNIFRVGDVKQSIYGFRGAKPSIMQELSKDPDILNITLANNFRSKKSIVDFNNYLFDKLLNVEGLSINYSKDDHQIAELDRQLTDNEKIKFQMLPKIPNVNDDYNKAMFIASNIKESIIKTKHKKFSDYCVLVRSHGAKKSLELAFKTYNIPYFIDNKMGYLNSYSLQIVISYLKYLYNPNDKISLATVTTSPMYQCDDILDQNLLNDDVSKLQTFNHIIDIFNYIININNFYDEHLNIQERTNVDLFYELITTNNFSTLAELINYIELSIANDSESSIPTSDEDNVVKVMTIHNSKGLQFNVVYLFSKKSTVRDKTSSILVHNDYGIGLKIVDDKYSYTSIEHMVIEHQTLIDDIEENLRVLYVALTRAKNDMHIVDIMVDEEDISELDFSFLLKEKSYTKLILSVLYATRFNLDIIQNTDDYISTNNNKITVENDIINLPKYKYESLPFELIKPSNHSPSTKVSLYEKANKGLTIGSLVHKIIETIDKDIVWTKDLIETYSKELSNSMINGIISLQVNDIFREASSHKHFFEYPFTIFNENNLTDGIIDFISFNDNNTITIIDFKSDRVETSEDLVKMYKNQLNTYKNSINIIYPSVTIYTYIYSLYLKEMIKL